MKLIEFLHQIDEARMAPLYHWINDTSIISILESNSINGEWEHFDILSGMSIYGTSFTRNKFLNVYKIIRIIVDQNKLAQTHKIIPLDGNVAFFAQKSSVYIRNKNVESDRKAPSKNSYLAEEFVLGPIKNLNRYITAIELKLNNFSSPYRRNILTIIKNYANKFNIPLYDISEGYNKPRLLKEGNDDEFHKAVRDETGYWGKAGAGSIIMSKKTGRVLLSYRSKHVEEPHTWGTWGGAIDIKENPLEAAKRETMEETGLRGTVQMVPLSVYQDKEAGFRFYNYLMLVENEFKPRLDWETERAEWFTLGQWPSPLHFGLKSLLGDPKNIAIIKSAIPKVQETRLIPTMRFRDESVFGGWITDTGKLIDTEDYALTHKDTFIDYIKRNDKAKYEALVNHIMTRHGQGWTPETINEFAVSGFAKDNGWIRLSYIENKFTNEFNIDLTRPTKESMITLKELIRIEKIDRYNVNNLVAFNKRDLMKLLFKFGSMDK